MSKYKLAIFDVDGTLLNTTEGVLSSVIYTMKELGLEVPSQAELLKFIGPPIQDSFKRQYGLEGDILQEIATIFRNRYKGDDLLKAYPYEGIFEAIERLKNDSVKIAIATYKRQDYALRIMQHFGFDQYTEIIYGADHENKLKKMDIIKKCLDDSGIIDYKDAVMIGDSDNDAIGADKIGVNFIGVTYGFDFKEKKDVDRFPNIGTATSPLEILKFF